MAGLNAGCALSSCQSPLVASSSCDQEWELETYQLSQVIKFMNDYNPQF